ncbi:hypothetical protein F5X98DRAFT_385519 [Xylaria grammica]|nr:hypothetical protein F5X98DRAFT_385519 [Xylaria grammica]
MPPPVVYRCCLRGDSIVVDHNSPDYQPQKLTIELKRTIRVPDGAGIAELPPDLDNFSLFKTRDFASNLPSYMTDQRGLFVTMYQREAMWVSFQSQCPFMIKIYAGGVNVVSGEPSSETIVTQMRRHALVDANKSIQDYVVTPKQPWIDGFAVAPGVVRQFVAMPLGQGYTVEAQLTGREFVGGLQFEITPSLPRAQWAPCTPEGSCSIVVKSLTGKLITIPCSRSDRIGNVKRSLQDKDGIPLDQQRLICHGRQMEDNLSLGHYNVINNGVITMIFRLRGGAWSGPMGMAAGGKVNQVIHEDDYDPGNWATGSTITIPVHILTTTMFRHVTGQQPPPCPIRASEYAELGLPFFKFSEEEPSGVSGAFNGVQSVNEINVNRGIAAGSEPDVKPRVVTIRGDMGAATTSRVSLNMINDPDGLVNPYGPLRDFRTLKRLKDELRYGSLPTEQ